MLYVVDVEWGYHARKGLFGHKHQCLIINNDTLPLFMARLTLPLSSLSIQRLFPYCGLEHDLIFWTRTSLEGCLNSDTSVNTLARSRLHYVLACEVHQFRHAGAVSNHVLAVGK